MWTEKYRPETLNDYRGASSEKKEIVKWLESDSDQPLLLHGQAGTGKTSLVEALANDKGLELVETNASESRTKKALREELEQATKQASFFGKEKIILIDEVDGMSGSDRGGVGMLRDIIGESRFPVVMTANDAYDSKIKSLRNMSKMVELGSVHTNSIAAQLRDILEEEGIDYEDGAVKRIARRSGGQMRSAINDLEAVARGREKLEKEHLSVLGGRDNRQEIFDTLKVIFKTEDPSKARESTNNLDEDAETFMQWVRENVPREYEKPGDRAEAYSWISRADLFNGRIRSRMAWSLMKYVYEFSSVGVALSKEERYDGWTRYQYPSKIKKMGQSRAARRKMDSTTSKIAERLHLSKTDVRNDLPFYAYLTQELGLEEAFELEKGEVEFLSSFAEDIQT